MLQHRLPPSGLFRIVFLFRLLIYCSQRTLLCFDINFICLCCTFSAGSRPEEPQVGKEAVTHERLAWLRFSLQRHCSGRCCTFRRKSPGIQGGLRDVFARGRSSCRIGLPRCGESSGTADEIWVARVDVRKLHMDEIFYHLACWLQASAKNFADDTENLLPQVSETPKLRHFSHEDHTLELLEDQVCAFQGRRLQLGDLPLDQQLEGGLRHEERGPGAGGILYRNTDVII
mmetsp:Transcript_93073/g.164581  ORF Transcript_93073/g.164581 Transcript_93073/m.164581 type:complete len:230 (+) Transcript_93073:596-1285(+)